MPRLAQPAPDSGAEKHWLAKFADLNVEPDRGRGAAPNKPLLLLCVLDMMDAGRFDSGRIEMSAELVFRFETYWSIVYERRRTKAEIRMPFHALGSRFDRVWQCQTDDGRSSNARETTRLCVLDPSLLSCLQSPAFRKKARQILLSGRYFTPFEQVALAAALKLPSPDSAEVQKLKQDAAAYTASQRKGRDGRFKVEVVTRYGFTCALTGYRLTAERGDIVEAAHIHQRAESLNDDPQNGLALTPNAHWMFDAGLWTIGENRRVMVAPARAFKEQTVPGGFSLRAFDGGTLFFKAGCNLQPYWPQFEWHRRNRFVG